MSILEVEGRDSLVEGADSKARFSRGGTVPSGNWTEVDLVWLDMARRRGR